MKILIIHHVTPDFAKSFNKEQLLGSLINLIENNNYDKIIATYFETNNIYKEIMQYTTQVEEWCWGWEDPQKYPEIYSKEIIKDIITVSTAHNFAYIYDWIKNLKENNICLTGGAKCECLQDLKETLDYLKIKNKIIKECIY